MSPFLSYKLSFFSFWLIILVVLLHAANVVELTEQSGIFDILQYFITYKICAIAVPLFL